MTLEEFNEKLKIIPPDDYINEFLEYDGNHDDYIWLNDWHEGQEDVVILGYIAMCDLKYNMIKWEELKK